MTRRVINHAFRPGYWPEDRVQKLKLLWPDLSLSLSDIGKSLGVSKNSVLSKAHQLLLTPRPGKSKSDGGHFSLSASGAFIHPERIAVGHHGSCLPAGHPYSLGILETGTGIKIDAGDFIRKGYEW